MRRFLLVVVCGASLAACGSSGSSSNGDTAPNAGTQEGSAGTLTWAKTGEVTGLDPQVNGSQVSWDILFRVYEQLVQIRDDGTIAPLLATSWKQVAPDAYVFQLRRDVRFSNGRRMTSADVVASFERVLDPELGSYFLSRLRDIETVTADGRYAVRFTLKRSTGTFLQGLAGLGASILPGKELKAGTFDPNKRLLGTGPYKVEEHRPEESWTLVQNPHYWRKGYPKIPKLVVLINNDPNARMAALRSGRASVVTSDDPDTPKLLDGTPNVRVVAQSTSDFYVLDLNAIGKSSKLRDERVRQAIALALDRRQIIDLALGGAGEPVPGGGGAVAALPDACEDTELTRPHPDKARELIAQAGAEGLSFPIEVNTGIPILNRIGQVVQAQLEEIGVRPTLRSIDYGAWVDKVYVKGDFDANLSFHTAYLDNWFGFANWSPPIIAASKAFLIDDPTFNRVLDESAALEPRSEQRAQAFQRLCDLSARHANKIALVTRTMFVAYRTDRVEPRVQELEPNSNTLKNVAEFAGS